MWADRVNKLLHLSPCAASFLFLVDDVEAVAIVFAKMVLKSSVIIIKKKRVKIPKLTNKYDREL
jgi:hypothetical protein